MKQFGPEKVTSTDRACERWMPLLKDKLST
jgi:hypothetical protein